ncbi:MAG: glycine--tRNA ligase subunit beta [Anaerolineae bacterium]|nr:glycine--tRNA ligase subunit beta [Anaerolineae bacterium]
MSQPLSFQQVIMHLEQYWADRGCLIWQPYSEKVGAGTNNPGTTLRVLGPEPWNVAYVEPSYRPDDGRYAENPNRMQMHTQYQVILKPDPGNPQELYLGSLEAIGIDMREHDVRFVEDKWESPVLGSWGLGWEVWLDGQEISQYTYFQQAGGLTLDPVAVELTYGLERIVMYLQKVRSVWEINWDGLHTYGDIYMRPEVEHCTYNFELADVERVTRMYDLSEAEARAAIARGLVIPAYDHILRCSHFFNVLDARGAIGVTERAAYFARMRDLSREVARLYVAQREEMGFPFMKAATDNALRAAEETSEGTAVEPSHQEPPGRSALLLEIGTEELPVGDLALALTQLGRAVPEMLAEARLEYESVRVVGTPRRQAVLVQGLVARQADRTAEVQGPPAKVAYDADGHPTRAAEGFARKQGLPVENLRIVTEDDKSYVVATVTEAGRPAADVLAEALPALVAGLRFPRAIRWNQTNVAFSRPIRWFVALLGNTAIPFEYAGIHSGRTTRGIRPYGSPAIRLDTADDYLPAMAAHHVVVDLDERRESVRTQVAALAASVGGSVPDDPALLEEVTNLIEYPTAVLGQFEPEYLALPSDVLITVMKKHQRFFPIVDDAGDGRLLPYFIAVRNGDDEHLDVVRQGYEDVIRARFADAKFFYENDVRQPLDAFLPRLDTLTFQQNLGSMLDKSRRLEALAPTVARALDLDADAIAFTRRAAQLAKADLATQLVVEFTSLQGLMGSHYSTLSGEERAVSTAIFEHYLPRFAGDEVPESGPGLALGLADRVDSLVGLFAAGLAPTGSADPYQLRRAALGIVESLIERQASLDLRSLMAEAAALMPLSVGAQVLDEVAAFVAERLRGWLRDRGFRHDVVDAILAARAHDPYAAYRAAGQLTAWVERDDWADLLNAYGRCIRIVRDRPERDEFRPGVDADPSTVALRHAYDTARTQVHPDSDVDRLLTAIHPMIPAINRFFDDVLVMHDDEALRRARLGLLFDIWALSDGIVDLTRLEGF